MCLTLQCLWSRIRVISRFGVVYNTFRCQLIHGLLTLLHQSIPSFHTSTPRIGGRGMEMTWTHTLSLKSTKKLLFTQYKKILFFVPPPTCHQVGETILGVGPFCHRRSPWNVLPLCNPNCMFISIRIKKDEGQGKEGVTLNLWSTQNPMKDKI